LVAASRSPCRRVLVLLLVVVVAQLVVKVISPF